MAEQETQQPAAEAEAAEAPGKFSLKLIIMIAVPVVLLIGGGLGWFLLSGGEAKVEPETAIVEGKDQPLKPKLSTPNYIAFSDDIVVNLQSSDDGKHHLRIAVTLMTREESNVETLKTNEPMFKSDLLELFQEQQFEKLLSADGKKALRESALQLVNQKAQGLKADGQEAPKIEAVLFTKFIME